MTKDSRSATTDPIFSLVAAECAAQLRAEGWAGDGESYDLHMNPGDAEVLRDALGRPGSWMRALTTEERRTFERLVREALTGTARS